MESERGVKTLVFDGWGQTRGGTENFVQWCWWRYYFLFFCTEQFLVFINNNGECVACLMICLEMGIIEFLKFDEINVYIGTNINS